MRGLVGSIVDGLEAKVTDISGLTWSALLGGPNSRSGVAVNLISALKVSTVLSATRVLAEGIAQLPLKLYREADNGAKTPAKDLPAYKILSRRPNDWMTSFEWREMAMFHAVLTGNHFAYKGIGGDRLVELIPLVTCAPRQLPDYTLVYDIGFPDGSVQTVDRSLIFHLRGPSWNGYLGMDIIHLAREAIGLSIATEETHASLHANGAQPGGVLSVKGSLDKPAKERLKEAWAQHQEGVRNKFRTAVLDMDATWTPLAMTGVDSQHIETRKFQIEEVCRALRVFPQMVGHSDKTATFASAESFFLAHVIHSLMPWVRRWEETIERDILDNEDGLIAKMSVQGLLRGDAAARATYYHNGILDGWLVRNEARAFEDLNPLPGLDDPLMPLNMTPNAGKGVADVPEPSDEPQPTNQPDAIETKAGRVLSAVNEGKIAQARDHLNDVLATVATGETP